MKYSDQDKITRGECKLKIKHENLDWVLGVLIQSKNLSVIRYYFLDILGKTQVWKNFSDVVPTLCNF